MVLMTRRSDSLASHTGQIAFPGGRLDPGETAVEAALREAFEEVALDPALVEVLGVGDAYETGTGFLVTPVVGWLTARPATTPSPPGGGGSAAASARRRGAAFVGLAALLTWAPRRASAVAHAACPDRSCRRAA